MNEIDQNKIKISIIGLFIVIIITSISISYIHLFWGSPRYVQDKYSIRGVYYGTYDFNDYNSPFPSGSNIDFIDKDQSDLNCKAIIISNKDNHKNVMECSDRNYFGKLNIANELNQKYGVIEFWIMVGQTRQNFYINIEDESKSEGIFLRFSNYKNIEYSERDFLKWNKIMKYSSNEWYHFKIKFDIGYHGDGTNDWHLSINGKDKDSKGFNYMGSPSIIKYLRFSTASIESGVISWIDAIGYSWDKDYSVGLNINPYNIKPLLNANFKLTINWNTFIRILNKENEHENVLNLYDDNNMKSLKGYFNFMEQNNGRIEWFMKVDDTFQSGVWLFGSTIEIGIFFKDNSNFGVYDLNSWRIIDINKSYVPDIWYHCRIDFECGNGKYKELDKGTYSIYIDGEFLGTYNFRIGNSVVIKRIGFLTSIDNLYEYSFYVDTFW